MQHTTMHYKTSVEFVQHFDEVEPTKMHEKEEKKKSKWEWLGEWMDKSELPTKGPGREEKNGNSRIN